jgi:hypothetical protein
MTKTSIKARVLFDHDGQKINSVVSGDLAERAIAEGWGDGHASAVKYAEKLAKESGSEEVVHEADDEQE